MSDDSEAKSSSSARPDDAPAETPDEVIEGELEEKAAEQFVSRAIQIVAERFSGPLPPPEYLERYEAVLPGLADRVVSMAEREQAHRHSTEDRVIGIEETLGKRGQLFGLIIALVALAIALVLGLAGQPIPAAVIGGAGLTGLVGLFLKRHRAEPAEPEEAPPPAPTKSKELSTGDEARPVERM